MKTYTLCIVMFQAVIEPLVVAEVEPLLLQLPLQVPVSLGNEAEVRMRSLDGRDHFTPILDWRPLSGAAAPGALEGRVQQQHGHVASDAIALSRNTGNRFQHRLPKPGLKPIELQNIGPCREVRIPSAGVDSSLYHNVGCRVVPGILGIPANEVLRMLGDTRVVRRHMVGHEIEEQVHAPLREFLPGNGETFRASEVFVNHVTSYAIGRTYVVLGTKIRKCSPEIVN